MLQKRSQNRKDGGRYPKRQLPLSEKKLLSSAGLKIIFKENTTLREIKKFPSGNFFIIS